MGGRHHHITYATTRGAHAIADHHDALREQAATAAAVTAAIPNASTFRRGDDVRIRAPHHQQVSADFRITDSGSRLTVIEIHVHNRDHARRIAELTTRLLDPPTPGPAAVHPEGGFTGEPVF
ncbi:hypothetical protein ACIBHY_52650 [Nonomuraea sp. NPDC050547]|uniref:hypothetical protein n=1 Tax=Nonomuraea sp. NPDC050547 TaxID=3364368 RepID=UPI0037B3D24B